jgi:serine/threonine protein kinase
VKLGFHKTTMEKVAIKIISKAYLQTSEILANATKREMAILKLVRHPNVVRYIDAVDDPNVPYVYIIMEYVEGCELFDYLLKCRRINEPEARNIFWQVCVAVDWCHQRNIW